MNAWVLAHGRELRRRGVRLRRRRGRPGYPSRFGPAFDAGDGLHLSAAGYRALAAAVRIGRLTGSPCLADDPAALALAR